MKKMLFGSLLLLCGIIGVILLVVLSINNRWEISQEGLLMGTATTWTFILFSIISLSGLGICFFEAYIRKPE